VIAGDPAAQGNVYAERAAGVSHLVALAQARTPAAENRTMWATVSFSGGTSSARGCSLALRIRCASCTSCPITEMAQIRAERMSRSGIALIIAETSAPLMGSTNSDRTGPAATGGRAFRAGAGREPTCCGPLEQRFEERAGEGGEHRFERAHPS